MKTKVVLICFLVSLVTWGVSSSFFPEIPSPVFLWSGSNYFTTKNSQFLETTSSNQIINVVHSILQNKGDAADIQFGKQFQTFNPPEMVVMYVVSSPHFPYKQIEPVLDSAISSIIIPYNYHQNTVPSFSLVETVRHSENEHKLVVSQGEDDQFMADDYVKNGELISYLEQNKDVLFKSGKSSIMIVFLPKGETEGLEFLKKVNSKVNDLSQGHYVAVLTADSPVEHISQTVDSVHTQIAVMQRDIFAAANDDLWPYAIWEGLLVSIVMLAMLFVGVFCTSTVQTPVRWGSTKYVCQFTEISDP